MLDMLVAATGERPGSDKRRCKQIAFAISRGRDLISKSGSGCAVLLVASSSGRNCLTRPRRQLLLLALVGELNLETLLTIWCGEKRAHLTPRRRLKPDSSEPGCADPYLAPGNKPRARVTRAELEHTFGCTYQANKCFTRHSRQHAETETSASVGPICGCGLRVRRGGAV